MQMWKGQKGAKSSIGIMTCTKFIYLLNSTSKNTKSIFSRVFIVWGLVLGMWCLDILTQ